ncbi:MAG: replication-associated recombination protein A [Candidatus Gracilibacteria bacterium]|nr:replication-associated recombination protein A [Candidatus Gracilibacteria bacterium]
MNSLFSQNITPLASLLRPEKLDDLVGQQHLIGAGKPIRKFIEAGRLPSILFWGPPGCGKTSIARVIANSLDAEFFHLSGVLSKKEDVVKIIAKAQKNFSEGRQTILFLDEIHRWTKSQQDVLLPWVEKGIVTLIGATTENPSFTVINALLSRCRTYVLEPIKSEEVVDFIMKNLPTISERYPNVNFGLPLDKGGGGDLVSDVPFREYNPNNKEKARKLRANMTEAERKLWLFLKQQQETWNRQKPIEHFIVDFYCSAYNLVIEVDGTTHCTEEEKMYDAHRTEILETLGLTVVRFTNEEVYKSYEGVCERIMEIIEKRKQNPPNPLSQGGMKPQNPFELIARLGGGDLRNTMNLLETACILQGEGMLTREMILEAGSKSLMYDQDGEEHHNLISAMHKSLRDSDGDAAIYWIGRMLAGGEDPRYIARRMMNFASEDIYDAQAIILANSVYEICEKMGMPECELPLLNVAYYLADAPKDNRIYMAQKAMHNDIREYGNLGVPLHLRNAPTELMKEIGYGKGYEYAHNLESKKSGQEHFPEELKGRKYRK